MKALLVDDERLAREELGFLLRSFDDVEVVGEAADGPGALERIEELQPEIVFLDVQMPGLNGLEVVRELLQRETPLPHIVFTTAYDQYAVAAFEVNAADYLLKPVERERLEQSIERARALARSPDDESARITQLLEHIRDDAAPPVRVLIRSGPRMVLVDAADVIFATVERNNIRIVSAELEGHSNYKTLDELHGTLGEKRFWRVHRSYLVNIDRIQEVMPWFKSSYRLRMGDTGGTEIPVSRAQTKRLRELFRL